MTASQQHYWEMGSGEWVAVAYLAYMGEPPLDIQLQRFRGWACGISANPI